MTVMASRSPRASRMSRTIAACSTLAITMSTATPGQDRLISSRTIVPADVLEAAGKSHDTFAVALAAARIPSSFVVSRTADRSLPSTPWTSGPARGRPAVADVIERFEREHTGYSATVANSILSVRPEGPNACTPVLSAQTNAHVFATSLRDGVQILLHDIKRSVRLPGPQEGSVGSAGSRPEEPRKPADVAWLSLSLPRGSLEQSLNAIVLAVPGTVWMLEEMPVRDGKASQCHLRLMRTTGGMQFTANLIGR